MPDDAALVGFDDVDAACFTIPSLTMVHQPPYETGRTAASMVVAAAECRPIERHVEIPTRLVLRESCGSTAPLAGACGMAR